MAKRILLFVLVCTVVTATEMVANAQEQPERGGQRFENPFDSASRSELSERKIEATEQRSKPVENYLAVFSHARVKKLLEAHPADDKIRSLKKERCKTALVEVEARLAEFRGGRSPVAVVLKSSNRLASSLLALEPDAPTRLAILENSVKVAQEIEKFATSNFHQGTGTRPEVAQAKYERLSAEILFEEEKARLQNVGRSESD